MKELKHFMYKLLFNNKLGKFVLNTNFGTRFPSAANYWENRYRKKGTSGPGSYGELAFYKASVINKFVGDNTISKVIEFGCGDGNQLQQFTFPAYTGLDVSPTVIEKCKHLFKNDLSKSFFLYEENASADTINAFKADLALSLDVIYHLLEDAVFETYMCHLFLSSTKFVIIYAWDVESPKNLHVRHRKFTKWIENNLHDWQLIQIIKNDTPLAACDFFIYQKHS